MLSLLPVALVAECGITAESWLANYEHSNTAYTSVTGHQHLRSINLIKSIGDCSLKLFVCKNKCTNMMYAYILVTALPVFVRLLDFNNGVEYYQAANTLITSLALSLFDNSIFLGHLLCLMPLNPPKAEEWLLTQREIVVRLECNSLNFPPNLSVVIYFIQHPVTASVEDCWCHWLNQTVWLIFSICLASFELKLDGNLNRTAVTLVSPPGQSDTQARTHTCTHRHTNTQTYTCTSSKRRREGGLVPE